MTTYLTLLYIQDPVICSLYIIYWYQYVICKKETSEKDRKAQAQKA